MKEKKIIEATPSSGNVFADIGIKNPEEYMAKAKLASQINKIIKDKTQKAAAELLGLDQPKISDLACGRLTGFSITRLIALLNKLNQDVEIVVKPHKHTRSNRDTGGHLTVSL